MSEQDALKIHEAQRNAELARADKTLAPVSLAMAILAVAVGALSMSGSARAQRSAAGADAREFPEGRISRRQNTRTLGCDAP